MMWWRRITRKRRVSPEWYRANGRVQAGFHWGGTVVARVRGRTATYVVAGSPKALDCTCDARQLPCPHVIAVAKEWEERSSEFVDLQARVAALPEAERATAIEMIQGQLFSRPGRILDALEKDDWIRLASAS